MTGKLGDISDFLKDDNGWLRPEYTTDDLRRDTGRPDEPYFRSAWEEQAYWLRSAFRLAVLSDSEELFDTCIKYINILIPPSLTDGSASGAEKRRTGTGVFATLAAYGDSDLLFDYYEYTSIAALSGYSAFAGFA